MPTTIEHQFSNLSTIESDESKPKEREFSSFVSPTKSSREDESSLSDESSHGSAEKDTMTKTHLQKTAHKIQEDQGMMADEPLLTENPQRFVIFPIQDNDVSNAFSFH
jgi:hypothetical protein